MNENNKQYKSIGEVARILDLIDKKTGKLSTHTIRFWEKEFKQIKPFIFAGNRRYYDHNTIHILKKIKFLLKNRGMTIKGAKNASQNSQAKSPDLRTCGESFPIYDLRELVKLLHNRACASLGPVMNCRERRGGRRL